MIKAFLFLLLAVPQAHTFEHQVLSTTVGAVAHIEAQSGECNGKKATISKGKDGLTLSVEESELQTKWTKIFFTPPQKEEAKSVAAFQALLKEFGIDGTKKIVDVAWKGGPIVVVYGKSSHAESLPYLAIYRDTKLPAELFSDGVTLRFTDYHKSVFPLAFPGRIDLIDAQSSHNFCLFIRKEYKQ
ncbi:hypothetical protein KAH37_03935 [bacterium]|nr:hypothetical protein [bacterium]